MEFFQVQNRLRVQVLRYPILAALLHGTRAVSVRQTLRHSTNGIKELLQTAPPIIRQGFHHVGHWPTPTFNFLWPPYEIGHRAGHYIFALWFLSSFFFFSRLISAVAEWMSTILLDMVWP